MPNFRDTCGARVHNARARTAFLKRNHSRRNFTTRIRRRAKVLCLVALVKNHDALGVFAAEPIYDLIETTLLLRLAH